MIQKETVTPRQLQISLTGSIFVEEANSLKKSLYGHIDSGSKSISIDMTNVDFIDGAGLKAFDEINKRAIDKGGRIAIKGLQGTVKKMFEMTQMNKSFDNKDK